MVYIEMVDIIFVLVSVNNLILVIGMVMLFGVLKIIFIVVNIMCLLL